jgi:hypothetical protein
VRAAAQEYPVTKKDLLTQPPAGPSRAAVPGVEDEVAHRRAGVGAAVLRRRARSLIHSLIRSPLHPFLLAAASVLSLYALNLRETFFADVAPALVAVLGAALILYLAIGAALRDLGARAAILTSVILFPSLNYAYLFQTPNRWLDGGYPMVAALPIALLILAAAVVLVVRARISFAAPQIILNGVALFMFLVPASEAAAYEWRNAGAGSIIKDDALEAAIAASAPAAATDELPDIYYLMFDRYASTRTLARHYDYDDQDLIDFLEENGFYVAPESTSNYFKTAYSVASAFHLDYINFLAEDERIAPSNWRPIYRMLHDHRVARFLKARGYEYIQLGSWWKGTHHNTFADENYSFGPSEFEMLYARETILRPLLHALFPASLVTRQLHWDNGQCQRVPRKVEQLKRLAGRSQPTFVFAHFLVPHGPYVFAPDGRCLSQEEAHRRGPIKGYVDQVQYAGKLIRELVPALLNGEGPKPIIILQSDEGPFPVRPNASWREAEDHHIQIKTSIQNAYYFPDQDYGDLYDDITPVNSFRILFNKLFGTELELLPDRVYGAPDVFNIYDFFDVTDVARAPRRQQRPVRRPSKGSNDTPVEPGVDDAEP